MIAVVVWVAFGLVVGSIAKSFFPIGDEHGMLATVGVGVVGSFVGGIVNYILAGGSDPYHPAGFALAILGAVATCAAWKWYSSQP